MKDYERRGSRIRTENPQNQSRQLVSCLVPLQALEGVGLGQGFLERGVRDLFLGSLGLGGDRSVRSGGGRGLPN